MPNLDREKKNMEDYNSRGRKEVAMRQQADGKMVAEKPQNLAGKRKEAPPSPTQATPTASVTPEKKSEDH